MLSWLANIMTTNMNTPGNPFGSSQPILRRFGPETTVRPSPALYNTCADVDASVTALRRMQSMLP
jgi:selenocysteine lyase/cysteine desulfurase